MLGNSVFYYWSSCCRRRWQNYVLQHEDFRRRRADWMMVGQITQACGFGSIWGGWCAGGATEELN